MIHGLTSHLPTSEEAMQQQASLSHKGEEPKKILPQGEAEQLFQQARQATFTSDRAGQHQSAGAAGLRDSEVRPEQTGSSGISRVRIPVEILTVAAVTVLLEFLRQRRGK